MNQPKFKFGDKVKNKKFEYPTAFIVERIEWGTVFSFLGAERKGFRYFPDPEKNEFWPEEDLELYQEPQRKTLYAYAHSAYQVIFMQIEEDRIKDHQNDVVYKRAPEYDLEYPEDK